MFNHKSAWTESILLNGLLELNRCSKQINVNWTLCSLTATELETARKLGLKAVQAAWYLQEGTTQPARRKYDFIQLEKPFELLKFVNM